MDTVKGLNKMHIKTDYVVIGSGLSALGAVMKLEKEGKKFLVIGSETRVFDRYPNQQLISSMEFGGASNYWHGVIPLMENSLEFLEIFKRFYSFTPIQSDKVNLFIPRRPISSKQFLPRDNVITQEVLRISESDIDEYMLELSDGSCVVSKKVIIACGVRYSHKLLLASGLIKKGPAYINDHISGYIGNIKKEKIIELLGQENLVVRNSKGYIVKAILDEENDILFTFRPALFEMKKERNQLRGGPIYGSKNKISIVYNLLVNFRIGRLIEAVALKYGFWPNSENYSIHFQVPCSKVHSYVNGAWNVDSNFNELGKKVAQVAKQRGFNLSRAFEKQLFYYGNHLFNLQVDKTPSHLWNNLVIVDASNVEKIGGTHHSFRQIIYAYKNVSEVL
jgi:hypothetical protein